MSRKLLTKSKKITLACYSVVIALMIVISIPTLVKAEGQSSKAEINFNQKWQNTPRTSMTILKKVLTGKNSSNGNKETILSGAETKMISLINQERAKAGLKELEIDYSLVKLAQGKSLDMVSHNYFGHISDRFGSIYDQLQGEQIPYRVVAENLAGARNYQKAQQYFLASPPHRSNILNPQFTKIGVGIIRGGPYGMIITQLFLG